jgi:hypothetical protein
MFNQILNLKGVQLLNKDAQKLVNGGGFPQECSFSADPDTDWCCHLPGGCTQN